MAARVGEASAELEMTFAARDRASAAYDGQRVGVFGLGAPELLIAATGALPVHLNLGTPAMGTLTEIDDVIERFVDADVRRFLNRLVAGDFHDYAAIIFSRDDAPALTAYQYACEWVRQGRAGALVPPLFLWNLVHTGTKPVQDFNEVQADKLEQFLFSLGLSITTEGLSAAARVAGRRRKALAGLRAIGGAGATAWSNAGRFMTAERHAELVETALDGADQAGRGGKPRFGLVGSPVSSGPLLAMLDSIGDLVCNAQPLGAFWPNAADEIADRSEYLVALAADPFCRRIVPTNRHRETLVAELAAADCDLVISQVAETDDSFGWEVPSLAATLARQGIGFLDLGFVAEEPSAEWLEQAAGRIADAMENRP